MIVETIKKLISSFFIETTVVIPETNMLQKKVVIITGASGGVGRAVGLTLLKEKAIVIAAGRNMQRLQKIYSKNNGHVFLFCADVTKEKDVKELVRTVIKKYGRIDALINCAGVFLEKSIENTTEKEFSNIVNVNMKGLFLMTREVVPYMKKRNQGLIINIGSKISHNSGVAPKKTLYAMTKYAVEGLSIALSNELHKWGIKVTCLMPGTINTFVSFKSKKYLSPYSVGYIILMMLQLEQVTFESIIFKSKKQYI